MTNKFSHALYASDFLAHGKRYFLTDLYILKLHAHASSTSPQGSPFNSCLLFLSSLVSSTTCLTIVDFAFDDRSRNAIEMCLLRFKVVSLLAL